MERRLVRPKLRLWMVPAVLLIILALLVVVPMVGIFTHMDSQSIHNVFS